MISYTLIRRPLFLISDSLLHVRSTIHDKKCHEGFCQLSRHLHLSALFARRWTVVSPEVLRQRRRNESGNLNKNADSTTHHSLEQCQEEESHIAKNKYIFNDVNQLQVHSNSNFVPKVSHSHNRGSDNVSTYKTNDDVRNYQPDLEQQLENANNNYIFDDLRQVRSNARMPRITFSHLNEASSESKPSGNQDTPLSFQKNVRHDYNSVGGSVNEAPIRHSHENKFYRPNKSWINEDRTRGHDEKENTQTGIHSQHHSTRKQYKQHRVYPLQDTDTEQQLRQSRIHPRHRFQPEEHKKISKRFTGEALFGIHPVKLALQSGRRHIYTLYLQEREAVTTLSQELEEMAILKAVKLEYCSKRDLDVMSEGRPHQGVCMDCSPLSMTSYSMDDAEEQARQLSTCTESRDDPPLWLLLYHVKDPMNFGAILRTSYFLGVDRILTTMTDSCPLSPVVSKASSGAMELLDVYNTHNGQLAELLQVHKANGWSVLGTDTTNKCEEKTISVHQHQLDKPTLLIIGSEGTGLPPWLLHECNQLLKVEPSVNHDTQSLSSAVTSLNVSVATGIILHSLTHKKQMKIGR